MHIRFALLEAIKAQLKTLPGFSGVWIQRIGPTRNAYPALTLYGDAESVDTLTLHPAPRPQDRVLTVSVNAWIRGTADDEKAELDMNEASVSVEAVVRKPAMADDLVLVATDFTVAEDEPEIHVCTLTYHVSYSTNEFNLSV